MIRLSWDAPWLMVQAACEDEECNHFGYDDRSPLVYHAETRADAERQLKIPTCCAAPRGIYRRESPGQYVLDS